MRLGGALLRSSAIAVVLGVLASALMGSASQASDPDLSWPPVYRGPDQVTDRIGFAIDDAGRWASQIRVASPGSQPVCSSLDDPQCVDLAKTYGWWVPRVAPPCQAALAWEECI